jgi:nucleoside-diphosphate-sugar epimerase
MKKGALVIISVIGLKYRYLFNRINSVLGMKCLVTGGAGFIGSHLVDALLERGDEVIVIDDFSAGKIENLPAEGDSLRIVRRDICENLDDVFSSGIEAVFHLAAMPRVQFSIENPLKTHDVNVNGTLNLLNCCKKYNVKRFVFSSSSAVYGEQKIKPFVEEMKVKPISPYALHKLIGEYYCKLFYEVYGLKTVCLRYFNVYGTKMDPDGAYALVVGKFIKLISNGDKIIINGDGEQTRDFIHVDDIVKANLLSSKIEKKECFGEVYNIGFGKGVSVNEVFRIVNDHYGGERKAEHGPEVLEPKHTLSDAKKASRDLGWEPEIEFNDGMKLVLDNSK